MVAQIEGRLYFSLQLAAHRLRTVADRCCLEVAGATAAQVGVMFVIAENPGGTQRHIANTLGQQESAVTTMVRRLEKAGLVQRKTRPDDRRAFALSLTRRGETALQRLEGELEAFNQIILKGIGEARAEALAHDLAELIELCNSSTLAPPAARPS